ncbi:MAG: hypothetical protein UR43_C0010G0008 [candidate division TM6 bacterium GW2011_GWF2_33_332]|nr:MAG: hypothetical protein UR43_C0010G0008 [candidate division TM6 bacterium GW2011_GWF2_33_332]
MSTFESPFSDLSKNRKLTDAELIKAIHFMVAAEYEETKLYMQFAESTDNDLAVAMIKNIANDEWVNTGESLQLHNELSSDEEKLYAEGTKEVKTEIWKMFKRMPKLTK